MISVEMDGGGYVFKIKQRFNLENSDDMRLNADAAVHSMQLIASQYLNFRYFCRLYFKNVRSVLLIS